MRQFPTGITWKGLAKKNQTNPSLPIPILYAVLVDSDFVGEKPDTTGKGVATQRGRKSYAFFEVLFWVGKRLGWVQTMTRRGA